MNLFKKVVLGLGALFSISAASGQPIPSPGTEGLKIFVTSTEDVIATFQGHSAGYTNDLYLNSPSNSLGLIFRNQTTPVGTSANLGSFAIGTLLTFRMFVNNTGISYYTGEASLNSDGLEHARVLDNWQPGVTLVGFEDLAGRPEFPGGFNDLSFSLTNVSTVIPTPVPEPSTYALMGLGLLAVSMAARRKRSV